MVLLRDPGNKKQDVLRKNRTTERQYVFDKVNHTAVILMMYSTVYTVRNLP